MIFVRVSGSDVTEIHYQPFDPVYGLKKSEEELRQEGILVEIIPQPEFIEGKVPILKYNQTNNTLYYEYEDIPPTKEELLEKEIEQLRQQLQLTQQALDELILGGM
jgi:hypothetical protein